MSEQIIYNVSSDYMELEQQFRKASIKSLLLVCDEAFGFLKIAGHLEGLAEKTGIEIVHFNDFTPNPLYESVVKGIALMHDRKCDAILAVGGGSAIDVAKCIKLYSDMEADVPYMQQEIIPNDLKLYAMPTTAGTGSEATRYAVIYYNGKKQSITHTSAIPSVVFFDESVLESLPIYQKKSTMMDAFCHAVESFWSVNSNDTSKEYSKEAIRIILDNMKGYLAGDSNTYGKMLKAANLAGKAINITQTTAGHAMCYKLTSLYGISHGHAAALCVARLWPYMVENTDKCVDDRGREYLDNVFAELAHIFGCDNALEAAESFDNIVKELKLGAPEAGNPAEYDILAASVNPVRLKNNPVKLENKAIIYIYHEIMEVR